MLAEDAADAGAQAVIVTPPFYFILPEEALYRHFAELAANSPLPVVVYNNPLYTGNNLAPTLIARLAEIDNIIGLKQSQADLGQLVEVIRLTGDRISICTGIDSQFYAALSVGARGIYSTAAAIVPAEMVRLWDLVQAGDHAGALAQHRRLQPLNRFLEYDPGYVSPTKEALTMMGLDCGPVRRPLPDFPAAERSALEHQLLAYLETGGFPEAQALSVADRHELLLRYVDVAMLRDVVERHGVANVTGLRWLVRHLLGSPGALFSVEKFHARLKAQGIAIARDTLHALLGHLEDCFLVRTLWVEAVSERRRMVNPRKIHPVDPGLIPVFDHTGRANRGHALETAVRVELERRRMQATYVKTKEGYEVDFLARMPGEPPALIQVAAELDDPATREREVRALLAARAEYPRASLHLVTLAPESAAGVPETVRVHAAWQWLLGDAPRG